MKFNDGLFLCSCIICFSFLVYRPFKGFIFNAERRTLTFILVNIFLTSLVVVLKSLFLMLGFKNEFLLEQINEFSYFILHNMLAPAFALYIFLVTGEAKKQEKKFYFIFLSPLLFLQILTLLTPFFNIVYKVELVDGVVKYSRSWGVYFAYIIGVGYLMIPVISMIRTWKTLDNRYMFGLQMFVSLVLIGVFVQALFVQLQIEAFLESVAVVGLIVSVDSNEGLYDSITKIPNCDSYKINVSLYHHYKYKYGVINIRILNLYYYNNVLISNDKDLLMRRITQKLVDIAPKAEVYKYDISTFIMLLSPKYDHKRIFEDVTKFFSNVMYINGVKIDFQTVISYAAVPRDLKYPEAHYRLAEYIPSNQSKMTILKGADLEFLKRNLWIQESIHRAINSKSFLVYYQPIWSPDAHKVVSFEALSRLKDPEHGFIPPLEFVKVAEENGTIIEFGEIIFEKVCSDIKKYNFEKMGIKYVEVNLSLYQLMSQDLVKKFVAILDKYGINPSMINLEITETSSILEVKNFESVIGELLKAGFTLSLDDYGTAYSNITNAISTNYLNIKIDSSILWKAHDDENTRRLLETTIKTFRSFGNNIVQEGVETREQYDFVSNAGANLIQGYFISKPIPIEEACEFVKNFRELKKE